MTDEPEPTPDTESWGGQDGFEIQSEGMENEFYKGGAQEVYYKLDATYVMGESLEVVAGAVTNFVFGGEVNFVAPLDVGIKLGLSLEMALAGKIEWQPKPCAFEFHGPHMAAYSLGHTEKSYGFAATSVGSHTQTVEGSSTWTTDFESTWIARSNMKLFAALKWQCEGRQVNITGAASCAISGGSKATVSSQTKTQVSGGTSSLLLNAAEATLATGSGGGIKATAAQTLISGTKVMIGEPGSPVFQLSQPWTTPPPRQVTTLASQLIDSKVTALEAELNKLKTQSVSKAQLADRFARAISTT